MSSSPEMSSPSSSHSYDSAFSMGVFSTRRTTMDIAQPRPSRPNSAKSVLSINDIEDFSSNNNFDNILDEADRIAAMATADAENLLRDSPSPPFWCPRRFMGNRSASGAILPAKAPGLLHDSYPIAPLPRGSIRNPHGIIGANRHKPNVNKAGQAFQAMSNIFGND
ncbi:MAG: hypothetical protein Q9169_005930, partial [Polycauliona sp. 2 TL-2023]